MRISTVTMFEQSTASMNRQQSDFLRVSQQIASGRRVVNPSDDPQAASRAIRVDQSKAMTEQYTEARVSARNSLAQTESILNSILDAVTSAKTLLIQSSSDTQNNENRESNASELRGIYETLIGQANATDGNGRYLFGGYKDNAPPFVRGADGDIYYQGDSNAREQRVDASRLMPVTQNGVSIFQSVPSGAGYIAEAASNNQGSVTFRGPQTVNVNDPGYGEDYRILFQEDSSVESGLSYQVQYFSDNGWADVGSAEEYLGEGQQVRFGGLSTTLTGTPAQGDEILVARAGGGQRGADLFRTLEAAIRSLETPVENESQQAALRNTLNTSMRDLDNALDNVATVRAAAGVRLNELDVIDSVAGNRMINYEQTLSDLVDLDYAAAISEYAMRQLGLQASQKAFVDVKSMSLFNYM